MAVKTLKQKGLTWVNIDKMDEESFNYLKTNFKFHHLDYEDLRGGKQTPKIDIYKNYLFLILHIPQWKNSTHSINNAELGFFIGEGYLITIQHGHSKLMKNFFYRCMKNPTVKKNWMDKGSGYLMYKIIDALFAPENLWTVLDISHDAEVVMRSSKVYVLSNGVIVESASPADLAWRNESEFSTLFPDLAKQIRSFERRKTARDGGGN